MFNKRDQRCAAVQLMFSTDPSYDNRIQVMCPGWWKQSFRLRLWYLVWFQVRATSCHLTSSKSAWKSTPKSTWMCRRVWWSPGAIRWPVADPGCGNGTRRRPTIPKRARLGFRRSATTLYPSLTAPLLPRPELAGLLRLVIHRGHYQHDLPQHQSQPDCRYPPSIRRALASACGKGVLPVPDPYRGGDWGWRRLHWIDVPTFPNSISPEVNVKTRLKFELAYYDTIVLYVIHYDTDTLRLLFHISASGLKSYYPTAALVFVGKFQVYKKKVK